MTNSFHKVNIIFRVMKKMFGFANKDSPIILDFKEMLTTLGTSKHLKFRVLSMQRDHKEARRSDNERATAFRIRTLP